MKTYNVKQGQTWAAIAFDIWTDEMLMWKLIEANPLYAHIVIFSGGEVLRVPEVEETETKAALPPWRK